MTEPETDADNPKRWGDMFTEDEVATLDASGMPMPILGAEPTPEEQQAIDAHQACHQEWDRLGERQRRGMTFHGWEAHLRTGGKQS